MEMSVLERQRVVLKWQQEQLLQLHSQQQQQQQQDQSFFNELSMMSFLPAQVQNFQGLDMGCGQSLNELLTRPIKADPGVEDNQYGMNYAISRTASCPPLVAEAAKSHTISDQKLIMSAAAGRESFKKRKAEKSLTSKQGDAEEESRSKRSKGSEEEEESKITEQNSNRKSNSNLKENNGNNNDKKNRETSGCTSKDNSKVSDVQKSDYIHVRARRGQATDSHSLAERVRREKISERMKYLQDLVPGCNKITGKAGMLDEIINYVQSLQRQVEFLSMKLATVNPRLDFSIDDLIAKEVFAACSSSMPTMGVSSDMSEPNYLQYNPIQQMDPGCGSQVQVNQIDMGLRRSISAPVPVPETFIDPSCFNQIPSSLPWESDLQNIYGMEFQQGRSISFPLQTFTGAIGASGLKMEM